MKITNGAFSWSSLIVIMLYNFSSSLLSSCGVVISANFVSKSIIACMCFLVEFSSPPNKTPICENVDLIKNCAYSIILRLYYTVNNVPWSCNLNRLLELYRAQFYLSNYQLLVMLNHLDQSENHYFLIDTG